VGDPTLELLGLGLFAAEDQGIKAGLVDDGCNLWTAKGVR
jgi:hypothetical protein